MRAAGQILFQNLLIGQQRETIILLCMALLLQGSVRYEVFSKVASFIQEQLLLADLKLSLGEEHCVTQYTASL